MAQSYEAIKNMDQDVHWDDFLDLDWLNDAPTSQEAASQEVGADA